MPLLPPVTIAIRGCMDALSRSAGRRELTLEPLRILPPLCEDVLRDVSAIHIFYAASERGDDLLAQCVGALLRRGREDIDHANPGVQHLRTQGLAERVCGCLGRREALECW